MICRHDVKAGVAACCRPPPAWRIVSIGAALCAAVVVLTLTGLALIVAPLSLAVIAACLAARFGLVWLGLRATRPVLIDVLE